MAAETTTLPVFPLSLVLFPGMTLPLHIFEERYKRMINLCLHEGTDFGVVLAGSPTAIPGQCLTYPVGTAAHITGATRFPDGCLNLITVGQRRFAIRALDWDLSYCTAHVSWLDDRDESGSDLRARTMRRWRALRTDLAALVGETPPEDDPPLADGAALSFTIAAALPVNNLEKQRLLEATETATRLQEIRRLVAREHGLLRYLTASHPEAISPEDDSAIVPN